MTAYMETFLPKDNEVTKRYFEKFKTKKSSKRKSSSVASPEKETRQSPRKKSKTQPGVVIREASPLQVQKPKGVLKRLRKLSEVPSPKVKKMAAKGKKKKQPVVEEKESSE